MIALLLLILAIPLSSQHSPLDSITYQEIIAAVAATKADTRFVEGSLFAVVSLNEPPKAQVLEGKPIQREAFVVLLDRDHNKTKPYHDVNAFVTGEAVDTLRSWFMRRWQIATHDKLELPEQPRTTIDVRPSFEVQAPHVALARTWPAMDKCEMPELRELLRLHQRAIGQAKRSIYIENQYFSSYEIAAALECRMRQGGPPLEIVMVLPKKSAGLKEGFSWQE